MSIKVMQWVFDHSEETSGNRLVLLALADRANDDGSNAWPSVERLARDARLSKRQTQNCLASLKESGAIVENGKSPRGTKVYSVVMGGAISAPPPEICDTGGVQSEALGVKPTSPELSLERSLERSTSRNVVWDTLVDLYGKPTPSEKTDFGKTVSEVRAALTEILPEAEWPDEIRRRVAAQDEGYRQHRLLRLRWTELGNKAVVSTEDEAAYWRRREAEQRQQDEPCVFCEGSGIDTVTKIGCVPCNGTGEGAF